MFRYSRRTGCATLNVVCEASTSPGIAAPIQSAATLAASSDDLEEPDKAEGDPELANLSDAHSTSSTVVAIALVATVVVVAGLVAAKRRHRLNPSPLEVPGTINSNPGFYPEFTVESTHYYPQPSIGETEDGLY